MRNKFLLGIVSVALVSCFGGSSSVDLLTTADNKWESFKTTSKLVLNYAGNIDEVKDVKAAIEALDKISYEDTEDLRKASAAFIKALKDAKDDINQLEDGLYGKINTSWGQYEKAADAYINSLPGVGN